MNLSKPTDAQLTRPMLDLVKKADSTLAKYNLTGHRAAVAIVLDWSGSMRSLYASGQVQRLVERLVALGHRFDDDGQIDLFAYHEGAAYIGTLTAADFGDVAGRIQRVMGGMGGTDYAAGIAAFRDRAFGSDTPRKVALTGNVQPNYVAFVTDGQNGGSNKECIEQFRSSSYEPVFIQCIALGVDYDPKADAQTVTKKAGFFGTKTVTETIPNDPPAEFAFLAKLDSEITGRLVDNAGFFATVQPDALSEEAFLDRMMGEYPEWLGLAKAKQLIG